MCELEQPLSAGTAGPVDRNLAEESAQWLTAIRTAEFVDRAAFVAWLTRSPRHVEEFMLAMTIHDGLQKIGGPRIAELIRQARSRKRRGLPVCDDKQLAVSKRLYSKYRPALLQILLKRGVPLEAAEELMIHAFEQAGAVVCDRKFEATNKLEEYLYRTACSLAPAYGQIDELRT